LITRAQGSGTHKGDGMSETKLKPCPFCGDTESLEVWHDSRTIIHPAYRVGCDNCGAHSGYSDRGDHVEAWNTRTDVADEIIAMIEESMNELHRTYINAQGTSLFTAAEIRLDLSEDLLEQAKAIKAKGEVSE